MIKTIAAGWEKTFSRRIPVVSTAFARNAANRLKTFHRDIEARARKVGAGIAGLSMLSQQVSAYESIFKDLSSTIKETIVAQQKEINREFVPVIAQHMEFAYDGCTNEAGPGSYARMKALMNGMYGLQNGSFPTCLQFTLMFYELNVAECFICLPFCSL